jgi:small subunit ribosomal protein S1
VVVLKIDVENRRLSLGHKQIEENPWETFIDIFPIGSIHQGTYVRNEDKDAIVAMPYGLDAICFKRNLKKKDGSAVEIDEIADFMILEVDKDRKRILVSHIKTWEEPSESKSGSRKRGSATAYKSASQSEKSTLGDLEALTQLKEKMEAKPKKAAAKKGKEE